MQKIPIDKTRYICFDEVNNTAINQNNLPEQMLERHSMIFDFYLEACPVQVYGIIDLIRNFHEEDWD